MLIASDPEFGELLKYVQNFQEASITQAIIEKSCSSPDFIGICVVIGGAFGDEWQDELIQLKDGTHLHSHWASTTEVIEETQRLDLSLDLPTELENLRTEGYKLRGDLGGGENKNPELETGSGLGRYGRIYIAVGTDIEWLECERPMKGKYKNNAVNRIFQAAYGYLTLI